jgi:hypothetical protein
MPQPDRRVAARRGHPSVFLVRKNSANEQRKSLAPDSSRQALLTDGRRSSGSAVSSTAPECCCQDRNGDRDF